MAFTENLQLSKNPFLNPSVGQITVLLASPDERTSALLISDYPVPSTSFLQPCSKPNASCVMNCDRFRHLIYFVMFCPVMTFAVDLVLNNQ